MRFDRRRPQSSAVSRSDNNASTAPPAEHGAACFGYPQRHWLVIDPLPGYASELNPVKLHLKAISSLQAT
jgi:hypothetical protein